MHFSFIQITQPGLSHANIDRCMGLAHYLLSNHPVLFLQWILRRSLECDPVIQLRLPGWPFYHLQQRLQNSGDQYFQTNDEWLPIILQLF